MYNKYKFLNLHITIYWIQLNGTSFRIKVLILPTQNTVLYCSVLPLKYAEDLGERQNLNHILSFFRATSPLPPSLPLLPYHQRHKRRCQWVNSPQPHPLVLPSNPFVYFLSYNNFHACPRFIPIKISLILKSCDVSLILVSSSYSYCVVLVWF